MLLNGSGPHFTFERGSRLITSTAAEELGWHSLMFLPRSTRPAHLQGEPSFVVGNRSRYFRRTVTIEVDALLASDNERPAAPSASTTLLRRFRCAVRFV